MYIGPEAVGPLASVAAAVTGVLLLFWRSVRDGFRRVAQRLWRR